MQNACHTSLAAGLDFWDQCYKDRDSTELSSDIHTDNMVLLWPTYITIYNIMILIAIVTETCPRFNAQNQ